MLATTGVQEKIKAATNCFEVFQISEYRGYRIRRSGAHQQLTIRVFDCGWEHEHPRFHIEVEADDGIRTSGGGAHSLEGALEKVRWEDLDA